MDSVSAFHGTENMLSSSQSIDAIAGRCPSCVPKIHVVYGLSRKPPQACRILLFQPTAFLSTPVSRRGTARIVKATDCKPICYAGIQPLDLSYAITKDIHSLTRLHFLLHDRLSRQLVSSHSHKEQYARAGRTSNVWSSCRSLPVNPDSPSSPWS